MRPGRNVRRVFILLLSLLPGLRFSQAAHQNESGKFRLHKFEQVLGEENYSIMKMDAESGSVEAGKRADLDVLDANPLDDIHNIRTVRMVLANGALYDPKPLWESVGFKAQ